MIDRGVLGGAEDARIRLWTDRLAERGHGEEYRSALVLSVQSDEAPSYISGLVARAIESALRENDSEAAISLLGTLSPQARDDFVEQEERLLLELNDWAGLGALSLRRVERTRDAQERQDGLLRALIS